MAGEKLARQVTVICSDDELLFDVDLSQEEEEDFLQKQSQPSTLDNMKETEIVDFTIQHNRNKLNQKVFTADRFISPRSKLQTKSTSDRKRKRDQQTTLTQDGKYFTNDDINRNHLKGTDDQVFFDHNGTWRVFKRKEAFFMSKHPGGCIFIIDHFEVDKNYYAVGHVYTLLQKTYIRNISNDHKFQSYISESKVDLNQYVRSRFLQIVRLKDLKDRIIDFSPPQNPITYEETESDEMHGFTFSYRHSLVDQKKSRLHMSIERPISKLQFMLIQHKHQFPSFVKALQRQLDCVKDALLCEKRKIGSHNQLETIADLRSILIANQSKKTPVFVEAFQTKLKEIEEKVMEYVGQNCPNNFLNEKDSLQKPNTTKETDSTLSVIEIINGVLDEQLEDKQNREKLRAKLYECELVHKTNILEEEHKGNSPSDSKKIPLLDIFAGIGGMSQGFIQSGFFDVKWAVEIKSEAATIFKLNHRDTFVFIEDVQVWLKKLQSAILSDGHNENSPYRKVLDALHIHFSPVSTAKKFHLKYFLRKNFLTLERYVCHF